MYTDRLNEHSLLEEEYFYKKERELINKMHESERQKQDLLARTAHYHKCACCGFDMKEAALDELQFLQCQHCDGIQLSMDMLVVMAQGKKLRTLIADLQIKKQAQEDEAERAKAIG